MPAEKPQGLPSLPSDAGSAVNASESAWKGRSSVKALFRELNALRLTWQYRHGGVTIDGTKYQINEDATAEGKRLVVRARVQAVRDYELQHQNDPDFTPILTQDVFDPATRTWIQGEASLIEDLGRLDQEEMTLLKGKIGKTKTTVGSEMYAKSDAAGGTAKESVLREMISMGRQSRFIMLQADMKDRAFYFDVGEAEKLGNIDTKRRALEKLLLAEVETASGSRTTRLDEILAQYKSRVETEADPMEQIRENARKFAEDNKVGDDYVAGANKSEAWRAIKEGAKRGGLLALAVAGAIFGTKAASIIGSGNYNEIMSILPVESFNIHNINAHDIPTLLLQAATYLVLPIFLAATGVGEAAARGLTDTYQGRVLGTKTRRRNQAVEKELTIVAQQEFGIPAPSHKSERLDYFETPDPVGGRRDFFATATADALPAAQ